MRRNSREVNLSRWFIKAPRELRGDEEPLRIWPAGRTVEDVQQWAREVRAARLVKSPASRHQAALSRGSSTGNPCPVGLRKFSFAGKGRFKEALAAIKDGARVLSWSEFPTFGGQVIGGVESPAPVSSQEMREGAGRPTLGVQNSDGLQVKTMIILGTIQRVEKIQLDDSREKGPDGKPVKVDLYQIVLNDATKPAQFRSDCQFITYLGKDKLLAAMGTLVPDDLVDEKVTFAAKEIKPANLLLKVRGSMVKGHHAGEALIREMEKGGVSVAAEPAPPPPSKKTAASS